MKLTSSVLVSDGLLVLTAAIWGFAFVAQRVGMDDLGPFAFNAVRYAIGAVVLVPLILYRRKRAGTKVAVAAKAKLPEWLAITIAGSVMFFGAAFQQLGLVTTTAGNAAFVTSLYVVIVPMIGVFFGRKPSAFDFLAAGIAVAGLYIITVGAGFAVAPGDLYVLAGSFFWALHILVIGKFATELDSVVLSAGQFAICATLNFASALIFEPAPFAGVSEAAIPLLYGGIFSCGVAFTLQIVAQVKAPPAHASIILAMEGLFGAIGGVLLLGEPASFRIVSGGALMLAAAVLPQIRRARRVARERAARP